ncbi:R8 protein [Tilletia horrida]|nr:R8 protein [Tilletia horrida]
MFYNLELLNKPKSRLGIVWLAATIGNRSSFKKLSKSDIGSVDLVKICQQLAAPDEAMALRLSSQLLYGTVKIYDQQLDSLQKAAEAMQLALKRSFLQSTMQTSKTEVLGLKVAAPKDITLGKIKSAGAITLKPNEYWCA